MRTLCYYIGILLLIQVTSGGYADETKDFLHQGGSFSILEQGGYDSVTTVEEMAKKGDHGIGGFEHLNGELVQINGTIYQITADGIVSIPPKDEKVAFMNTVRFNPEWNIQLTGPMNLSQIKDKIHETFPSSDRMYAIRIDGTFSEMTTRSVPAQQKPYPPLSAVIANQTLFNLTDSTGTITGFWFPEWMKGVNVAGYHLHYLSEDKTAGGHLLSSLIINGTASIDPIYSFSMDNEVLYEMFIE